MAFQDDSPRMPDGSYYDGHNLLRMLRDGNSPFADRWDVNLLVCEIEEKLSAKVVDIPSVSMGSNNYGFHMRLSNGRKVLARLARGDVNMPEFDGFSIDSQVPELEFEAAVYELLRAEPDIMVSRLLHYRVPYEYPFPHTEIPKDLKGRRLLVFEEADGEKIEWRSLLIQQKSKILKQSAAIRSALFCFNPPLQFAANWFLSRLFEQKPISLPVPVAPTRSFCAALFISKINATIQNVGDMIGWESDNETVGPVAAAAKQSLLRLIPYILPEEKADKPVLYRLVLDHGDFGIHNMSITKDESKVTSLFDWETGCIVPAILSDPEMAVTVDLVADENASPSICRLPKDVTSDDRSEFMDWAAQYFDSLYDKAPEYRLVIKEGKDARHLWYALRAWRGTDPEGYFGDLGIWAEEKLKDLSFKSDNAS